LSDAATTSGKPHYLSTTRTSAFREIWQFRQLLLSLVARDLKVKYQRSALGLLWTLLNPLLMVLVFVAVFTSVLRIRVDGFWAFLISGIFAFQFATVSMNRATSILRSYSGLRRSVAFPSEIAVLSTLLAKLAEFLIEMAIVIFAIFVFYHHGAPVTVVLLPVLIIVLFLLVAGLVFPLSVISVMYYDVEHAMPSIMRLLFFISPIMYPVSMIPENLLPYFYLNPFVGLIQLFHMILYEGVWPPWQLLTAVSAVSVGIFFVGFWIFQKLEDVCVEIA
jgi:ABC-type polysaccharide/polyol phosphate export permease